MRDMADEVRELFNRVCGDVAPSIIVEEFPDQVVLLQDARLQVYQVKQEIKRPPDGEIEWDTWGLVCFSQKWIGSAFIAALNRGDLQPVEMSFDEARKLAKSKKVLCLFLLDDPDKIIVHWVK